MLQDRNSLAILQRQLEKLLPVIINLSQDAKFIESIVYPNAKERPYTKDEEDLNIRIVQHLSDGYTHNQIGEKERINKRTIEGRILRMCRKYNVSNTLALVCLFFRRKYIV